MWVQKRAYASTECLHQMPVIWLLDLQFIVHCCFVKKHDNVNQSGSFIHWNGTEMHGLRNIGLKQSFWEEEFLSLKKATESKINALPYNAWKKCLSWCERPKFAIKRVVYHEISLDSTRCREWSQRSVNGENEENWEWALVGETYIFHDMIWKIHWIEHEWPYR